MMANRISPVEAEAQDLTESWEDANGSLSNVVVRTPRTAGHSVLNVPAPGAGVDATPIVEAALLLLKAEGGGVLNLGPGIFRFETFNTIGIADRAHLRLANMSDIDIVGDDTEFVFPHMKDGISIVGCNRVRLRGIKMRHDLFLSGLGTMVSGDGGTNLRLDDPVPDGTSVYGVYSYDDISQSWPGGRVLTPPGSSAVATQINPTTYSNSSYHQLGEGQRVSVKFDWYSPRLIYIRDEEARWNIANPSSDFRDDGNIKGINNDIVLDGIDMTNTSLGVLIRSRGRGFAFVNSMMLPRENQPFSTTYDAFHVVSAGGDILVRGSIIQASGDDNMNLRTPIHRVSDIEPNRVTITNTVSHLRGGDTLAFFDANGTYIGSRYVGVVGPSVNDVRTMYLDNGVSIENAVYARSHELISSRYAIVGNTFGKNFGHGLTLQLPNGLVKGNVLDGNSAAAIRLMTSYSQWLEGAGAINVRVTGNTFLNGGVNDALSEEKRGVVLVYAKVSTNDFVPEPHNGPIMIDNNVFINPFGQCIAAHSAQNVTLSANECPW